MKEYCIINKGISNYQIVCNKDSDPATRYACKILQLILYKATNTLIPYKSDKCLKVGPELMVGHNVRGVTFKDDPWKEESDKFCVNSFNDDIYFNGSNGRSVIYSVIKFLELSINYRVLSSDVEIFDKKDIISFKEIHIKECLPFEYREIYFNDSFEEKFSLMNMLNGSLSNLSERCGGKMKWYNFHHSFGDLLNPNIYFDKHPEYFSLIDGERRKEHTELCLSNNDVFEIVYDHLVDWIKDNPDCKVFSVAQDEWMGHFIKMACECPNCLKIDQENGSQSGSIINFVNKILTRLEKEYPDILIHTFAYQYSRKPPKKLIPHPNMIVRLTNIECSWSRSICEDATIDENSRGGLFLKDLNGWSKITNRLYIWDYTVNFRNYLLPFPSFRSMAKNIELYKKSNVKGILIQGNFSYGGGGYMDEAKAYVAARLIRENPDSLDNILKEFMNGYYGSCGNKVLEYVNLWEDHIKDYELWLYDDADSEYFDDEIINKAHKILDEAKELCDDEHRIRLDKVLIGMEYLDLVRLPMDTNNRNELIDEFYLKLKNLGITEIMERVRLEDSIEIMKKSRYAKDRKGYESLYYIMR